MNAMLLTVLLLGQTPQAPKPPQAPPVRALIEFIDYSTGANEAVARGCPLVTFVGCPVRELHGSGAVWCGTPTLTGYPSTRAGIIVISIPDGKGWMNWQATLSSFATDDQIRAALAPKVVTPMARPFSK